MADEALSSLQLYILQTAEEHDGRYLLPRRLRASNPPSELDLKYEACDGLQYAGYANWLQGQSAPGIRLTGKPWPKP